MRVFRASVGSALLLFLTACPDTRPTPETFCREYGNAVTDFRVRCGELSAAGGEDIRYLVNGNTCQLDERITFDRDGAKKCLEKFKTIECGARRLPCEDPPIGAGTVTTGGSCFEGECAPGLYCDLSTGCPGHCETPIAVGEQAVGPCVQGAWPLEGVCAQRVPIGESCAARPSLERPTCAWGAVCGVADVCVEDRGVAAGEYCNADESRYCAFGLQCLGDGCEPWSKAGEACSPSRGCQWDLTCSPQSVCLADLEEGSECGEGDRCRLHLQCTQTQDDSYRCKQRLEAGGNCAVGGFQCAAGLTCVLRPGSIDPELYGKCAKPLGRDAECKANNGEDPCGRGLHCGPGGTCLDQKTTGKKCNGSHECQSERCQADGGCADSCFPPAP